MGIGRLLLLALISWHSAGAQDLRTIWDQYKKKSKGDLTTYLTSLGRDSLVNLTIREVQKRQREFDPSIYPTIRVFTGSPGVVVTFQLAIRYVENDKPRQYDLTANLTQRSFSWTLMGGDGEPVAFVWDAEARAAVRWVLNWPDSVRVDRWAFPDGSQMTIRDDGESYVVETQTRHGDFESYRIDKRTRRTSDRMHGTGSGRAQNEMKELFR